MSWLGADRPGKDNEEVYGSILGIDTAGIKLLADEGVI